MTDPEHAKGILVGSENQELFLVRADHAGAWLLFMERDILYQHVVSILIIVVIPRIINLVIDTKHRVVS